LRTQKREAAEQAAALSKQKQEAMDEARNAQLEREKAIHEAKMAKTAAAIRAAKTRAKEFEEAAQQAELKRNRIRAARIELTRLKEIEQNKAAAAQKAAEEAAQLLQ